MEIKKLYMVRAWVNGKRDRRGNLPQHPYMSKNIVVNNLDTAKTIFNSEKNRIQTYQYLSKCSSGRCQLFEPDIHNDGTLANSPKDNGENIDEYSFEN